jgi:membrane protein
MPRVPDVDRSLVTLKPSLKGSVSFLVASWRRFRTTDPAEMAAALSFRTLFSLFPLLVVATLLTRAILADRFESFVGGLITEVGLDDLQIGDEGVVAGEWLRGLVSDAAGINLSGLGIVGGAAVVFSAIWLLVAIERSFDRVAATHARRPLRRKLLVYWTALTLTPVLLGAVPLGVRLGLSISQLPDLMPALANFISGTTGFLSIWALLFATYAFIPNRRMSWKATLAGALGAALVIVAGKAALGSLAARSFGASKLFASLGLLPVLMFWIYLMWMVVLYGLHLAVLIDWTLPRLRVGALRHARWEAIDDPGRPRAMGRARTRRVR